MQLLETKIKIRQVLGSKAGWNPMAFVHQMYLHHWET
jgi:hypothetical protein